MLKAPGLRAMYQNAFEPQEVKVLTDAFDMACAFVEQSPPDMFPEPSVAKQILANKIIGLAKAGEKDRIKIANLALGHLRQVSQCRISEMRLWLRIAGDDQAPAPPFQSDRPKF